MLTTTEPATRAEFAAQILATNSKAMRMLHHRDNAEYVSAHRQIDLLLTCMEACE